MHETLESRLLLASAARISDFVAGPESSVSAPAMAALNGKLLFSAVDPTAGMELFISDGTAAGTKLLKDINPSGSSLPHGFVASPSGVLFFTADDGTRNQVWRTDGTAAGTFRITNVPKGARAYTFTNGRLFMFMHNGIGQDETLAVSDGAAAGNGTIIFTGFLLHLANVNNIAIFSGENDTSGNPQMFRSDGTAGGTSVLANILGGATSEAVVLNNVLYFQGAVTGSEMELARTDGTAAGTRIFADINPSGASDPHDLTVSGNKLFFVANDGTNGAQIYRTDGATVTRITSLPGTGSIASIQDLADVNGTLFFSYRNGAGPATLYKLAGNTTPVAISAGESTTSILDVVPIGSKLFFTALGNADNKVRLYESDGSSVKLVAGDAGTGASFPFSVGNKLFFQAEDPEHGAELHVVNDVTDPTVPFSVRLKIHPNARGHTNVIDEGESLTFEAITTGQVEKVYWDFGDGKLIYTGKAKKPTHEYRDNFAAPTRVRVKVKPLGTDVFVNASVPLTVNNLKPRVKVTMPGVFVAWAPMPFAGSVDDPDVKNGKIKSVTINWGDGSTSDVPLNSGGVFIGAKFWTERMLFGRSVRITANDGDASATKRQTVIVDDIITFSASDAAAAALKLAGTYIGGSSGNDRITVRRDPAASAELLLTLQIDQLEDIVKRIKGDEVPLVRMFGGPGRDRLEIASDVNVRGHFFGGNGNDTLRGGMARDSLFGEGGSDSIDGRGGKDTEKQ
jgi:ELWxxDGT repeat protein